MCYLCWQEILEITFWGQFCSSTCVWEVFLLLQAEFGPHVRHNLLGPFHANGLSCLQWISLFQQGIELWPCISRLFFEFQNTGSGVSLLLNAKFAGVEILTEPFGGGKKNVLKEKYLKAVSCMNG